MLETISISLLALISLLVNAVTIYRWIMDYRTREKINDQAFHMIRGLALANTRRANMTVRRIQTLEQENKLNEESMIFLENIYSDAKSNIETLLATAKALKPSEAAKLPYDGDALLSESIINNCELQLKQRELEKKLNITTANTATEHGSI